MAVVYLAHDLKHNRKVAVKVLHPQIAVTLGAKQFLKEIQVSAGLTHPHILPLHDSGEVNEFVYYVMPYVEGETLRDRLDREQRLPLEDALSIACDIADGLAYAHERGVVHQDIKPDNILIGSGHAVIADFGVAGAISAAGRDGIPVSGSKGGTAEYGSPEQITGDHVDARSDLYSLGCVLYEMLVGQLPQVGPTPQAIMASRIKNPAPCVTSARDDVPEHVADALRKVLARDPSSRFADASQFGAQLTVTPAQPAWVLGPSGPYLVAGVFIVSSLIVLTVVNLLVTALGLPDWVLPGAVLLLIIGFPVIIATALVARGTLRPPPAAKRLLTWRRAIAGGVLALAGWGVVVTAILELGSRRAPPFVDTRAIAVLPFEVIGQESEDVADSSLYHIARAAADMIVQGITASGYGTIIPLKSGANTIGQGLNRQDQHAFARQLGASLLITGWLHQDGDSLLIEARLSDPNDDRMLDAVGPVVGPAASPMKSADMLRQRVMSSLAALQGANSEPKGSR